MIFLRRTPLTELRHRTWSRRPVPEACKSVTTMLVPDELRLLHFLADRYYTYSGQIVDAGSFLGGSTVALASGLQASLARRHGVPSKLIHSYDLFQVEDWTRGIFFPAETKAGESTRATFDRNTKAFASLIDVREGDITHSRWDEGPIEILFIDLAKHWIVCDWITENLFPHLIPGQSVVIQQDYLYHHWNAWLHITMEYFHENFEILCDTTCNSVVFLFRKPFAAGVIRSNLVGAMGMAQKINLMDGAAARFSGKQREWLHAAKQHYLQMMTHDVSKI